MFSENINYAYAMLSDCQSDFMTTAQVLKLEIWVWQPKANGCFNLVIPLEVYYPVILCADWWLCHH